MGQIPIPRSRLGMLSEEEEGVKGPVEEGGRIDTGIIDHLGPRGKALKIDGATSMGIPDPYIGVSVHGLDALDARPQFFGHQTHGLGIARGIAARLIPTRDAGYALQVGQNIDFHSLTPFVGFLQMYGDCFCVRGTKR